MHLKHLTALMLVSAVFLLGMGGLGGTPEGTLPDTDPSVTVSLLDRTGQRSELSQFSIDGRTFLQGTLGRGSVTIPFADILRVSFGDVLREEVAVTVHLRTGKAVELSIRKRSQLAGRLPVGIYRIPAADVDQLVFK